MEVEILDGPVDGIIPVEAHRRLLNYHIGPEDIELTFNQRLAHENGWSHGYADYVVEEYKRFAYLCTHSNQVCTPSKDVDQAWHLHLTYTTDYWNKFCPKLLGKELHHGPTIGGMEDEMKYRQHYIETLQLYESVFGRKPPSNIWKDVDTRFSHDSNTQWVDLASNIVITKNSLMLKIIAAAIIGVLIGRFI